MSGAFYKLTLNKKYYKLAILKVSLQAVLLNQK